MFVSPTFRRGLPLLAALLVLGSAGKATAHQVPSITVEAEFSRDRNFTLRVNLDPRLVLSDDPTTLPPVPGSWYLERTPEEAKKIHEDVAAYLRHNLELVFGAKTVALPSLEVKPIDGTDNTPFKTETVELHLLASGQGQLPATARNFALRLGREASSSLILLNKVEGQEAPSLRVIFPGEISEAFELIGVRTLSKTGELQDLPGEGSLSWKARGVVSLLLMLTWIIFRNKWKAPARRQR